MVDEANFTSCSECTFNKAKTLILCGLSSTQIQGILNKFKQIRDLNITNSSISALDLNFPTIYSLAFCNITFKSKISLNSAIGKLIFYSCNNTEFVKCNPHVGLRVSKNTSSTEDWFNWFKNFKSIKSFNSDVPMSKRIRYLPRTIRVFEEEVIFDLENIDLAQIKQKFPLIQVTLCRIQIEIIEALNIKVIKPIMSQTEEKFSVRPKIITVEEENAVELNKHAELFEEVEIVRVEGDAFDYDCLNEKVKEINFLQFPLKEEKMRSLEENKWKFENTEIRLELMFELQAKVILNSLGKVKKIIINEVYEGLMKEYPQFKFEISKE